jgi:hypothetical protein
MNKCESCKFYKINDCLEPHTEKAISEPGSQDFCCDNGYKYWQPKPTPAVSTVLTDWGTSYSPTDVAKVQDAHTRQKRDEYWLGKLKAIIPNICKMCTYGNEAGRHCHNEDDEETKCEEREAFDRLITEMEGK